MSIKVLLTMENRGYDYSAISNYLKKNGYLVDWNPLNQADPLEIIETAKGYDAVIAGVEKWTEPIMHALSGNLKIIARYGIGYDSVDLDAAAKFGIAVTNTPGTMSGAVAEMALTLILNISRRICTFDKMVKSGQWWQCYMGAQLEGKTVGILGYGRIGQKLAQYLQGFRCNTVAYDLCFNQKAASLAGVKPVSLDELIKESDYISLHLPLTIETAGIVSRDFLYNMKPTAYLINTARGGLINERELIDALRRKKVAGAALDVYRQEPVDKESSLLKLDNVILTPHVSSATMEGCREAGLLAADNIIDLFEGREPRNILNRDANPEGSK